MSPRLLGWVLSAWSAGFAAVHVAWALGWRGGVPADTAPIHERPVFLAYDLVAAVLMVGAALVAWLLARGGLPTRTRDRLVLATRVGAGLALLRGAPALVLDVATGTWTGVGPLADAWFVVAALLGLALAALVTRASDGRPAGASAGRVRPAGPGARAGSPAPGPPPPAGGAS